MFKLNILAFMISFAIGIFFVYTTMPDKKTILIYPSPDNIDHIQYKDQADTCFQFKQMKETCPSDPSLISKTPIQAS